MARRRVQRAEQGLVEPPAGLEPPAPRRLGRSVPSIRVQKSVLGALGVTQALPAAPGTRERTEKEALRSIPVRLPTLASLPA
ncbi:MAG: hypothetical protein M0005_05395 [Actinomycetota bacterium]|nr:hypothetical protein [Actinomycetota bacterium]